MENKSRVSTQTRNNWLMDAGLFLTGLVTILSGIYFLFLPDGGFKGGRNPFYGIRILFLRETWEWLHTWIGLAMVVIALVHIVFHWKWIKNMAKRVGTSLRGGSISLNTRGKYNLALNTTTALSFLISAISGFYFLLVPEIKGGSTSEQLFIFTRTTWDMLHTWSSVVFIVLAILHFAIHWGWITKVTRKVVQFTKPIQKPEPVSLPVQAVSANKYKEYKMIKKAFGITLLVAVIGLLAFGAINRTSAKAEEVSIGVEEEYLAYGNGNGNGNAGYGNENEGLSSNGLVAGSEAQEDVTGYGYGEPLIETLPLGELNQAETDALLFMYEEEKLARDVYTYFSALYTQPMFANISRSEQTHMDLVKALIERYSLTVNNDAVAGEFSNADLQKLYDELTVSGSQSLANALKVGAAIEEIDILDLKESLAQTDQEDVKQVFESLLYGSYNHLNSFSSLFANESGTPYVPQFMSEAEYAEFQQYLADNGLFNFGGGRGRGNGGQGGGGGGRR